MNHIQNFLRQSLYLSKPHAIISRQSPSIVSRLYSTGGAAPDSITAIESAPRRNPVPPPADDDADKLYKVVELELRGNDSAVLKSFAKFAMTTANHLDIQAKSWSLRKPLHERYTVLKTAHVNKKHRVQYEFRTYFMFVQYKYLTGSTADTVLEYVERNLPEGVALKATKIQLQAVPDYILKSGGD